VTGGQGAAAFHRDDGGERAFQIGLSGQFLGESGFFEEAANAPFVVAQAGQDLSGRVGQNVECDLFADTINRAITVSGDRGIIGRNVGSDQEDLIFLDIFGAAGRQDSARRWAAGVDGEGGRAGYSGAARTFQVFGQGDGAGDSAG
jgi:hypothetical protein